jgi:mannose-6-phosphate isomerase
MEPVILGGLLRPYAWGAIDAMAPWTGTASGGPEAELWFGAHTSGRSPVVSAHEADAVHTDLLVKVLAAAGPLSIQIHPDPDAIKTLTATGLGHLLADSREKIEMLIAVEPFDALAGIRPVDQGSAILVAMGRTPQAELLRDGHIAACIHSLLDEPVTEQDVEAALSVLSDDDRGVLEQVVSAFPDDRGLSVAFLMRPYRLAPGDALCIPSGVVHAYVRGLAVEVMTSSDDVLRLGLTTKEIAVEAALTALRTDLGPVHLPSVVGTQHYVPEANPFTVHRVVNATAAAPAGSTVLAFDGPTVMTRGDGADGHGGARIEVPHGCAALTADLDWAVSTRGTCYVASIVANVAASPSQGT